MKKYRIKYIKQIRGIIFFLIFSSLIFFSIIPISVTGCAVKDIKLDDVQEAIKGTAEISEIMTCRNVDSKYAPVEPTSVFSAGTNSIYLSVKFTNFKTTDILKVIWTYIDADKELIVQEFSPPEYGSGYHSFNIEIADKFPGGDYKAQVEFNGDIVKIVDFSVESE